MKKITIYITLGAIIALLLSSCAKDFLERTPKDMITIDSYYQTDAQVNSASAVLYGYPWYDYNDNASWAIGDVLSGNLWSNWDKVGQFHVYSVNNDNSVVSSAWSSLFNVIALSNTVIDNVSASNSTAISTAIKSRVIGEARFMRAMAYFYLVRLWGEVPIIEHNIEQSANPIIPKNHKEDIYKFIISDMEFAETNCLEKYSGQEVGRITYWAAKSALAKIYLTMGDYEKAKNYAKDVIDNSGHDLMPIYADLFYTKNNNNNESVFALQWVSGQNYRSGNSIQAYWACSSEITGNAAAWGSYMGPTIDLRDLFEANPIDKRRKSTYMIRGDKYPELNQAGGGYHYTYVDGQAISPTFSAQKKYVVGTAADNGGQGAAQSMGNNTYMIRFADLYLSYIEAVIGDNAQTTDPQAIDYFHRIRKRAGYYIEPKAITIEDLLNERRLEFAMEGQFIFDLLRYYRLYPEKTLNFLCNVERGLYEWIPQGGSNYTITTRSAKYTATKDDLVLPIPISETDKNPLLLKDAVPYNF